MVQKEGSAPDGVDHDNGFDQLTKVGWSSDDYNDFEALLNVSNSFNLLEATRLILERWLVLEGPVTRAGSQDNNTLDLDGDEL